MHANTRRNLRTVLTGMTNNLSGNISASEASIYLEYISAHSRLLKHVSTVCPDTRAFEYEAKASALSKHFIQCGANSTADTSGYFSDQSPICSPIREDRSAKLEREKLELELKLNELKNSKIDLEVWLHFSLSVSL